MMVQCVTCCGLILRVSHPSSSHCNVLIVFDYRYPGMGCESHRSWLLVWSRCCNTGILHFKSVSFAHYCFSLYSLIHRIKLIWSVELISWWWRALNGILVIQYSLYGQLPTIAIGMYDVVWGHVTLYCVKNMITWWYTYTYGCKAMLHLCLIWVSSMQVNGAIATCGIFCIFVYFRALCLKVAAFKDRGRMHLNLDKLLHVTPSTQMLHTQIECVAVLE